MSTPDDAERLSPLAQRWPRASKFLLSGCAATVAELGTRPSSLGLPRSTSRGRPRVYLTQELNQGLQHCRQILYQLSYQKNLTFT